MQLFFTSDLHLGHANISAYCHRPWFRDEYMVDGVWRDEETRLSCQELGDKTIIHNCNSRMKPQDRLIHVGDFCNKGRNCGVDGSRRAVEDWESQFIAPIIHIEGNHDRNNGVKLAFRRVTLSFGGRLWLITHKPPLPETVPDNIRGILCGHVHNAWDHQFLGDIPMINVGVDVHNFMPLSKSEIVGLVTRLEASR